MTPPSSTRAKTPSRGMMQSPTALYMAQWLWHSLPIWVISSSTSAAAQQRAHGQGAEVEAAHDQVLAEVAVDHVRALRAEGLYLVGGEQAHLAVPAPGVGVALNAPVGDEFARSRRRASVRPSSRLYIRQVRFPCYLASNLRHQLLSVICGGVLESSAGAACLNSVRVSPRVSRRRLRPPRSSARRSAPSSKQRQGFR